MATSPPPAQGPDAIGNSLWASGKMDYLKGFGLDGKSTIEYHIDKAKILSQGEISLYSQRVKNDGPVDQTSEISGSETVTEEFGYSNSLGVTVGVSTEFTCGFPYLAEEKIEISVETSYEHEWSGSNSRSKTWSFSTPMNVPPHIDNGRQSGSQEV
jgi:Clostridium epsilon toxin ETX/Bacillus mosquitocidal toxin MTX2